MTSRFTCCKHPETRAFLIFSGGLAVVLAAFLFVAVGLSSDQLPFPADADISDAVTSHWPNALFLRRAILDEHTFPLWRPLIMSGQPFAANPLNKVWYPFQWLVLLLPPTTHLNLLTWLHLLMGGMGAYGWGRASGLHALPAALTGTGYALAPRLIAAVGAGHLDLVYAAAWFPWLLWALARAIRPTPARHAVVTIGVLLALCFLADVRLSAYVFVLAAAYTAWRYTSMPDRREHRRQQASILAGGVLLAAGLTAIQWVPLLLYAPRLSRTTITVQDAAVHSLAPGQWVGLLIGDHGGGWEAMVYVGASILLLAGFALWQRPRQLWFWGAALLVIALWSMGDQFVVWSALARAIPPLRWWRVPPRAWLLAALILPYLAGWGLQLLTEMTSATRAVRLAAVGVLGGGMACAITSAVMLVPPLEWTAAAGLLALPLTALLGGVALTRRAPARTVMTLFVLLAASDLLWIDRTLVTARGEETWLDPYRELAAFLIDDGAVRVYSPSYSLPQPAAAYWTIAQFGGVDPFQMANYVTAAEAATGVTARGYSVTIPAFDTTDDSGDFRLANRSAIPDARRLGEWLVTHVVAAYPLRVDGLEWVATINGTYVYRNRYTPDVALDWDGPNRVTIDTAALVAAAPPHPLNAVATGQWDASPGDLPDQTPGLPGSHAGRRPTWTLTYRRDEIGWGLAVGALLASAGLWVNRRWSHA